MDAGAVHLTIVCNLLNSMCVEGEARHFMISINTYIYDVISGVHSKGSQRTNCEGASLLLYLMETNTRGVFPVFFLF